MTEQTTNEKPTDGLPIIKSGVCPIEDGTCPTLVKDLHKEDPEFCGYHAHITRAKYVKPNQPAQTNNRAINVNIPVDPADANICDGCE